MRHVIAFLLLFGMTSVCWGKTYFASCHLCDPGNPSDPQVVAILDRYGAQTNPALTPLDRVSIAEDTPSDSLGDYYYTTWQFTRANGILRWLPTAQGYAPTAWTGGSGGGGGGGGSGIHGGISVVGEAWNFTCSIGGSPIDCDTGGPA